MPNFTYTQRGANIQVEGVDEPPNALSTAFSTQQAHIEDALDRVPDAHLSAIPTIVVGERPPSGGGFYRSPRLIRLNRRTFASIWNRQFLFTLIHEIGHAVDAHRNIVAGFVARTQRQGRDWTTFRAIVYRGRNRRPDRTPQYGEHFAEGYAHMLTRPSRLTVPQQALMRRLARMP